MNHNKDTLKLALEATISAHLQTPFQLTEYKDDSSDPLRFVVNGIIQRHSMPANVEVIVKKEGFALFYWFITDEEIVMPDKHVGQITLGKDVCVSDPCYNREVWCMTQLQHVLPGTWNVQASIDTIDWWGKRTYALALYHDDLADRGLKNLSWQPRAMLGVDSGTMSVIDDLHYRRLNGSAESFESDAAAQKQFNDVCFERSTNHVGLYEVDGKNVGVICSSGLGDGSYPLEVAELGFKIVAMRIRFM